MPKYTRRQFLTGSASVALGSALGLPALNALANQPLNEEKHKLKIVVIGAHPDDPETVFGGLMALYAKAGHEVVAAYLTKGEAGIEGKSHSEAAQIRTHEALTACKILNVRPEFLGQTDGNCEITPERYQQMHQFLAKENPDLLFTHWPIDTHRDHRICSVLVYDAWLYSGRKSVLYYGEAMTGMQSQNFIPTDYIDISTVIDAKHQACFAHVSQQIKETYAEHHGQMEVFRGMESGFGYAEAFVKQAKSPRSILP